MTQEQSRGRVKWFSPEKSFGFIIPDNAGNGARDVFVHISAVEKAGLNTLNEGDEVFYDLENFKGKDQATNLRKAA